MFGEYSLFFSNGEDEYEYRTYDAYFAKQVISQANHSVGKAWNKTKNTLQVFKKTEL